MYIQSPGLIEGRSDMENLTPKERVFGTLRNLKRIVENAPDLTAERERLRVALDRCLSWEYEVMDVEPHN